MNRVIIYTDGGCVPNPGIGGWGAVLIAAGHRKELSGGELESTNNRMELTAAIEALRALKRSCEVDLHTDSQYVMNGITQWMKGWKARGWHGKSGPVKNVDLWKELDKEVQRHKINWTWVRGHTGVAENERCDQLAEAEIARLQEDARYP